MENKTTVTNAVLRTCVIVPCLVRAQPSVDPVAKFAADDQTVAVTEAKVARCATVTVPFRGVAGCVVWAGIPAGIVACLTTDA